MGEHKRLMRLERVWAENPIWFVTSCRAKRKKDLSRKTVASILLHEWQSAKFRHGWRIGYYVIMPDHVHFFCANESGSETLSDMMCAWKQWTAKRLIRELGFNAPVWQPRFFDHVLRSEESYAEKWSYVRENPVRANLVLKTEDWPWWGEVERL